MAGFKLFLFGAPRIEDDGQTVKLASRKTTALLAYLALAKAPLRRETLLNLLWPEENLSHGRALLRRTLSGLKSTLPKGWLDCDRETIRFQPDSGFWLDVREFRDQLQACGGHGHPDAEICPACEDHLSRATTLYSDDFMHGFSLDDSVDFDDWQLFQNETLHQEMLSGLGKLVACLIMKGEHITALPPARRRLDLDPLNEAAHCDLMRLYVWTHQRGTAIRQFLECKRQLSSQLGLDPLPATLELGRLIEAGCLPFPTFKEAIAPPLKGEQNPPQNKDFPLASDQSARIAEPRTETLQVQKLDIPSTNLPLLLTSFIGRDKETAEIQRLLAAAPARLVTLTGAGGTGKTRLALHVGDALQPSLADGVWLLELANMTNSERVPQALAKVFSLSDPSGRSWTESLTSFLEHRRILLILDNCEHLVDACAHLVKSLLQSCIGLRILATSRQRLGVEGEITFYVPPLLSPTQEEFVGVADLAHYEATLLFTERAQAQAPEFYPSEENAKVIGEICRRLDGIPLALELAAARIRLLSVEQIAQRINDAFRLLVSGERTALPRHKTLRAMIDWSYNLLAQAEQVVLQELSVFSGGWTLEAAEAVCSGEDVLDSVERLVDQSLVQVTGGNPPRFRMYETIRQYAAEKLDGGGRKRQVNERHLAFFLALAERLEPQTRSFRQIECLNQLEAELPNLRTALGWGLENDLEPELRLASSLIWLWHLRSHRLEGLDWLERGLERAQQFPVRPQIMAKALYTDGHLWCMAGRSDLTEPRMLESLRIYRDLGEEGKGGAANALSMLGIREMREALTIYREGGDAFYHGLCLLFLAPEVWDLECGSAEAGRMMEEALAIFTRLGDPDMVASVNMWLGGWALDRLELDIAREFFNKSLEIHQKAGNWDSIANIQLCLGILSETDGDYASALEYYQEILKTGRRLEASDMIAAGLSAMGHLFLLMGNTGQARACLGEALHFESAGLLSWYNAPLIAYNNLGVLAWDEGDQKQAERYFSTAWDFVKDNLFQRATYNCVKGSLLCVGGDVSEASDRLRESIQFYLERKLWGGMGLPLDGLARLAVRSQPEQAARMFGAAEKMNPYINNFLYRTERAGREEALQLLKETLGEKRLMALWAEGQALQPEEIAAIALNEA